MAGRGGERFEKRQRERDRQEKAQAKRARREERKEQAEGEDEGPSEDELLAQVAALNEQHAEKKIDQATYETRKAELFEALGLEI
jgi:hypothetical protein